MFRLKYFVLSLLLASWTLMWCFYFEVRAKALKILNEYQMVWLLRRSKIKLLADAFSLSQFQKEHSWIWYHIPDFWVISKQLRILDLNLPFNNCGCVTYIVYYIACLRYSIFTVLAIFSKSFVSAGNANFFQCKKKVFCAIAKTG